MVPCESTIRRALQCLDAADFDRWAGVWAQQRTAPPPGRRRLVAVDGRTLRGSASSAEPGRHLLAALDHAHGVVLGQVDVQAKTNEIPRLPHRRPLVPTGACSGAWIGKHCGRVRIWSIHLHDHLHISHERMPRRVHTT